MAHAVHKKDLALRGVVLAAVLCMAPFVDYVPWLGDEGVLLHAAARMIEGERLYADVFGFLPPAGYLVTASWLASVGTSFGSARLLALLVLTAIAASVHVGARLAGASRGGAAVLAITWLVATQGDGTVLIHHWLTTLWSMLAAIATLLALQSRNPRAAVVAGGMIGAAGMTTSTRGAALAVAVLIVVAASKRWRQLAATCAGMTIAPVFCLLYLAVDGTVVEALRCFIQWPLENYASIQSLSYGDGASVQSRPILLALPIGLLLLIARVVRGQRRGHDALAFALLVVATLGALPRTDAVHLMYVAPLCAFALAGSWPVRPAPRAAVAVLVLALVVPSSIKLVRHAARVRALPAVALPRGTVRLHRRNDADALAPVVRAVAATSAESSVFVYPYAPLLAFLIERPFPSRFDIFTPGYSRADEYDATAARVVTEADYVIVDKRWSDPSQILATWPALENPDPPEKRRLEDQLEAHFEAVVDNPRYRFARRRKIQPSSTSSAARDTIAPRTSPSGR